MVSRKTRFSTVNTIDRYSRQRLQLGDVYPEDSPQQCVKVTYISPNVGNKADNMRSVARLKSKTLLGGGGSGPDD